LPVLEGLLRDDPIHSSGAVIHALRYCGAAGASILVPLLSDDIHGIYASESLVFIGASALPALRKVTGFFAPDSIKYSAKAVIESIEKRSA